MKRATAIIGANYGDEGKGKLTDFICSQIPDSVVVRFNGGAQAGHTVVTPSGTRQVFHHLGSGSFTGAKTYLAKHFVCNPILFWHEYREFCDKSGLTPIVACDPRCYITTPYDMIINQLVEDERGADRHGSCGVGFGETIERNRYPAFRLLKSNISKLTEADLTAAIKNIRDYWMPTRLAQLKVEKLPKEDKRLSDKMLATFIEAILQFNNCVASAGLEFIEASQHIVFEGAQGLALDMDRGNFPHVTRSNTGLQNVMPIRKVLNLDLDVIYVTRAYLTRHGAGPLPDQYPNAPNIKDETNFDNPYQGPLRFANLNIPELLARIETDLKAADRVKVASIAVTCTDQPIPFNHAKLGREIVVKYLGNGPARNNIERT